MLVVSGKDKGAKGKVLKAYPEANKVLVEGVNRIKKHTPISTNQRGSQSGGIVTQEAPIHVSNVMIVDSDGKPPRRLPRRRRDRQEGPNFPPQRQGHLMTTDTHPGASLAQEEKVLPRLKKRYREEIRDSLQSQFGYPNVMQIPGVVKVVVNMGVGDAARDAKLINGAVTDLSLITGQRPEIRRARKSIAQFKLREGMPIGARVTLRGDRMWEFLDRLTSIALPRIRDFRGLVAQAVRRQRQLHLRADRAVGVPRDRRGQHRPASRHGHHRRHLGDERRRRKSAVAGARLSVQGELDQMAKKALVNKASASRSSRCAPTRAATGADVRMRCTASSGCAGSACGRWRTPARMPGVQHERARVVPEGNARNAPLS